MIDACIAGLLRYAEDTGLIEADDRLWARNRLLEALQLDGCDPDCAPAELPLADLLRELTEDEIAYEMLEREERYEHDKATWIAEERKAIARVMKADGYPVEEICRLTKLSEHEIEKL